MTGPGLPRTSRVVWPARTSTPWSGPSRATLPSTTTTESSSACAARWKRVPRTLAVPASVVTRKGCSSFAAIAKKASPCRVAWRANEPGSPAVAVAVVRRLPGPSRITLPSSRRTMAVSPEAVMNSRKTGEPFTTRAGESARAYQMARPATAAAAAQPPCWTNRSRPGLRCAGDRNLRASAFRITCPAGGGSPGSTIRSTARPPSIRRLRSDRVRCASAELFRHASTDLVSSSVVCWCR